jgi:hypothetical protein
MSYRNLFSCSVRIAGRDSNVMPFSASTFLLQSPHLYWLPPSSFSGSTKARMASWRSWWPGWEHVYVYEYVWHPCVGVWMGEYIEWTADVYKRWITLHCTILHTTLHYTIHYTTLHTKLHNALHCILHYTTQCTTLHSTIPLISSATSKNSTCLTLFLLHVRHCMCERECVLALIFIHTTLYRIVLHCTSSHYTLHMHYTVSYCGITLHTTHYTLHMHYTVSYCSITLHTAHALHCVVL